MARTSRLARTGGFTQGIAMLRDLLGGSFRHDTCEALAGKPTLGDALIELRRGMDAHCWDGVGGRSRLLFVKDLDARTRVDGFHALHDWDGLRDGLNPSIIPIDVLDFVARAHGHSRTARSSLAVLLDYYFLYLLSLLSLRVWDGDDPDRDVAELERLLADLQGTGGSGHRFVDDAATLLLVATSHYELEERGFGALLTRARALGQRHQEAIALGHAAAMGCHLRFGFEATYAKSTAAMRDDNVADYPWLAFSLLVLMRQYDRLTAAGTDDAACARVIEAIINGLSADPALFLDAPAHQSVWSSDAEREEWTALLARHRQRLREESEALQPDECIYSPLAFFFNFSQNVVKAAVVDAVLWGDPAKLSLNDLLTGVADSEEQALARQRRAIIFMQYAQSRPDPIRGRLMPVIVYDPEAGRRAFDAVVRLL